MRMDLILTCQWPSSAFATDAHFSGPVKRCGFVPPKAISLDSPFSPSVKYTPKCECNTLPSDCSVFRKLKAGDRESFWRPRPRIPSKAKDLKGCVDISTAITM